MNEARARPGVRPARPAAQPLNRWIVGETQKTAAAVTGALEAYRFNDAALGLYHFVWDTFCDWYVELAKPLLTRRGRRRPGGDPGHRRLGAGAGAAPAAPDRALRHRGAVAAAVRPARRHADRRAPGRALGGELVDAEAEAELGWLVRTDRRHPHRPHRAQRAARRPAHPAPAGRRAATRGWLERHREAIQRLARRRRDRRATSGRSRRSRWSWWSTRRPSPCRSAT